MFIFLKNIPPAANCHQAHVIATTRNFRRNHATRIAALQMIIESLRSTNNKLNAQVVEQQVEATMDHMIDQIEHNELIDAIRRERQMECNEVMNTIRRENRIMRNNNFERVRKAIKLLHHESLY